MKMEIVVRDPYGDPRGVDEEKIELDEEDLRLNNEFNPAEMMVDGSDSWMGINVTEEKLKEISLKSNRKISIDVELAVGTIDFDGVEFVANFEEFKDGGD